MELVDLADAPQVIPVLAEWHVREWRHLYPDWSVGTAVEEFDGMLQPHRVPRTIVAFAGDGRSAHDVVGSVSLIEDDELPGFEAARPWLASLYVAPPSRGRGLGADLVAAAVTCARDLGEERLFLFTAGQDQFYERLGWRPIARSAMNGHDAVVMKIHTAAEAPRRGLASRWCTSPFSRGAYSYLRPTGTPCDRETLSGPVHPGLRLAGEAASMQFPGTLHGAWLSGEAAADQLVAELAPSPRIVVVGAGLAGIAAAGAAQGHGAAVTIVEALPHAGGRAASDRRLGGPVNLGAAWLHGTEGHPLFEAAVRLDAVGGGDQFDDASTFLAGAREIAADELGPLRAAMDEVRTTVERAAASARAGDSVGDVLERSLRDLGLDSTAMTVVRCWLRGEYENLYAAPPADLSLQHGLEPFRLPGADVMVSVGMDQLLATLTTDLDIRYDSVVATVRRRAGGWTVQAGDDELVADGVVVTVSTGVLAASPDLFDPPLPANVQAALGRIGLGRVAKAFFTFDDAFWRPRRAFWLAADPPRCFELWVDVSEVRGGPTLCAFAVGAEAEAVERMTEDELLELAWADLRSAEGLIPHLSRT